MKKIFLSLFVMLMLAYVSYAGCWMHRNGKYVRWEKPTTITINGADYFDPNHTEEDLILGGYTYIENTPECPIWEMYYDYDGLAVYQIFSETNMVEIPIDDETKQVAQQFAWIMGNYFPDIGAITNRVITEDYVTDFFSAKLLAGTLTAQDLGFATLMERFFTVLKTSPYNSVPNTTWDFPFGQDYITSPVIKRYYLKEGEKVYIE